MYIENELSHSQKEILIGEMANIIRDEQTRSDTIDKVTKLIISELIFLKKYDSLQSLSDHQLI